MSLAHCFNIADLRLAAQKRLPRGIFEFVDRGAEDELALANNCEAFRRLRLAPRVMRDVSGRSARTVLFGKTVDMPLVIAPTGAAGLLWHQGEVALAKAAAAAGIPFTVSTGSMTAMETVSERAGGQLWFHLNMWRDRDLSFELIERVIAARYEVLVLTVDAVVPPNREYNQRNGFSLPFSPKPRAIVDMLWHPRWLAGVLGRYAMAGGLPTYQNYPEKLRVPVTKNPQTLLALRNDSLTWEDVNHIRSIWKGPLVIKGIQHPDDARLALDHGADGIVVSNHGGRNLDSALAPVDILPSVVKAVGGKTTILMDGGIRRGSDIAKTIALGADAVQIGRATLYGVAVAGEAGAAKALAFLRAELSQTMAYLGRNAVSELDGTVFGEDAPDRSR
jgi:isopentenyl diphosphate isomerase/L-lactate dehydrogenase-like FMN-dependent dehydrogenase